jgi:lipoprotein-releasing system permease protein
MRAFHEADQKPKGADREAAFDKLHDMVLPQDLQVSGIFNPPRLQDQTNLTFALVPLNVAQEVFQWEDKVPIISVDLDDPYKAGDVKYALEQGKMLPPNWKAYTWMERHQALFDTVKNELEMMYFVLLMIVVVAAFCVMNTMITVTVQKRREIGIISALGARISQVMWVFLSQGMIVGIAGSLTGLGLGWLITYFRNDIRRLISMATGHEIFNSKIYGPIEIPARILPMDLLTICGTAFVLCTAAALIPAFLAARTEPAKALRD